MGLTKTAIRTSLIVGTILALATSAQADRRTGLFGNLLITDQDDMFLFPQDTLRYRNRISIDFNGAQNQGNALFSLGDEESAFGVALHRGDVTIPGAFIFLSPWDASPNAALDPGSPLDPGGFGVQPATMIDLLYAMDNGIGLRVAFGSAQNSQVEADAPAGSPLAGNPQTGEQEIYLMGTVGYGMGERGVDGRYDFSGSLLIDFGKSVLVGDDQEDSSLFSLSGLFRGFMPVDGTMDLGLLGAVAFQSGSQSFENADPKFAATSTTFALTAGVGPAMRFGDASVAAYATGSLAVQERDPNDDSDAEDDQSLATTIVIPGVNVAVEVPLNDWFFVRTGAEYRWRANLTANEQNAASANTFGEFGWNAGAGIKIDGFTFDGALQHGFVTNGPDFIGGGAPGFLFMANLTYDFDAQRSGVVPAEEPAAEPAPEEEEVVEPPVVVPVQPAPVEGAVQPANGTIEPAPAPVAPLPLPASPPGVQ